MGYPLYKVVIYLYLNGKFNATDLFVASVHARRPFCAYFRLMPQSKVEYKKPAKVVVSGAAGNIAYAILFMIGQGKMLGPDQPINLCMLDVYE